MREQLLETFTRVGTMYKRIKIIGREDCVNFYGIDETATLIFISTLKGDFPELRGEFGISDTTLFLSLLRFSLYNEAGATLTTKRGLNPQLGEETVLEFHFRDAKKKGTNFRAMSGKLIKEPKLDQNIPWSIDIELNREEIARLAQLSTMMGLVGKMFTLSMDGSDLVASMGGGSGATHSSTITLKEGITGHFSSVAEFSSKQFLDVAKRFGRDNVRVRATNGLIEMSQTVGEQHFQYFVRGHKP